MKAAVLHSPDGISALRHEDVPRPAPSSGEALVRVRATSVMAADLPTLDGVSAPAPGLPGPRYPMIMGNEFAGTVVECPGNEIAPGTTVACGFGGYGFTRNGGHAEYVVARVADLWPFTSSLPWEVIAALPKAYGSASMTRRALGWTGGTLLIRGASTAIGLALCEMAKADGLQVVGTTRSPGKAILMQGLGFDRVIVDDEEPIAPKVRALLPSGVDVAVEMMGFPAVVDTLGCVRPGGTLCMVGILQEQGASRAGKIPQDRLALVAPSPQWFIPAGVRLTTAMQNGPIRMETPDGGNSGIQQWLDRIAEGVYRPLIQRMFPLQQVAEAYRLLETSEDLGRIVITVDNNQ